MGVEPGLLKAFSGQRAPGMRRAPPCPDSDTARLLCCKWVQSSQGQPGVCAFLSRGAEEALAPYSLSRRVWTGRPTSLDGWQKGRVGGGQRGGEGRVRRL